MVAFSAGDRNQSPQPTSIDVSNKLVHITEAENRETPRPKEN